ncbi:MAG: hypothetical protein ACI82Z_000681 [Cellvibrionaceae bacterium]|jgi:hypothetical protein
MDSRVYLRALWIRRCHRYQRIKRLACVYRYIKPIIKILSVLPRKARLAQNHQTLAEINKAVGGSNSVITWPENPGELKFLAKNLQAIKTIV